MAAPIYVDTAKTYDLMLLISTGPKMGYGDDRDKQVSNQAGVPMWEADVTVKHRHPGARPDNIVVTMTAPSNPAAGVPCGQQVFLDGLRFTIAAPSQAEGKFGSYIKGGRLSWSADDIRLQSVPVPSPAPRRDGDQKAA